MKGLLDIPSIKNLASAYRILQSKKNEMDLRKLSIFSQWTRFDPRLMEQLIVYLSKNWQSINAVELNKEILKHVWPQTLAVILEHCELLLKHDKTLYRNWMRTVTTNITELPYQSYFIGLRPFASVAIQVSALHPLKCYEKWGFAEDELQFNKAQLYPKNSFSKISRENLLKNYAFKNKRFYMTDYLDLCKHSISIRQAQRDLKSFSWIRSYGQTKARSYIAV